MLHCMELPSRVSEINHHELVVLEKKISDSQRTTRLQLALLSANLEYEMLWLHDSYILIAPYPEANTIICHAWSKQISQRCAMG
jgi:hypothetical protein